MIFRMGELFCGPGGLGWAAAHTALNHNGENYNIHPVWANDKDLDTCRTYDLNIHGGTGIASGSVIAKPVEGLDIPGLGKIDAFAFGFPCNDYSNVGEKHGIGGKYGPLYSAGVEVLEEHKPKWFLAENVSGLHHADKGRTFQKIASELACAGPGYRLCIHCYRFEDYGVPQNRHRIIIVGIDQSLGMDFKVPAPTTAGDPRTAQEALEVPPIPAGATCQEHTRQSQAVIKRLMHTPPGKNAWYEGIPEEHRLHVKKAHLSQIYKRLEAGKPAYTLTGSGGGGTHCYHWSDPRALTNRERARLQTFPDEFHFIGTKEGVRKQIGMAVPPHGAQIIFEAILKTFADIPYDTVPASYASFAPSDAASWTQHQLNFETSVE